MRLFVFGAFLVLLLFTPSLAQRHATLAVCGATLIDGTGNPPLPNSVVLINGNRIAKVGTTKTVSIPPGSRRIDVAGKFVLPGLIDTHLHLDNVGLSDVGELHPRYDMPENLRHLVETNARLDLISGFTTIRDLGSTEVVLQVRDAINAGKIIGPRILAAGLQLVKKDTSQSREPTFLEFDGPDNARAMVRYLGDLGVDVIKIRLTHSRTIPSLEEVHAIVEEAHRLGFKATAHTDVPADDLVWLAIKARADGIEHNAPLRTRDDRIITMMAQHGMSVMGGEGAFWLQRIDTTGIIDSLDDAQLRLYSDDILSALRLGIDSVHRQTEQMEKSGWDRQQRQKSFIHEVARARAAGVLLVFGADCGGYGMVHGEQYKALYGETQIGSSPIQAIVMATRDAARALGKIQELGTIQEGKLADLLILNDNPLNDLRNVHHIFRVIKEGIFYDPAELMVSTR